MTRGPREVAADQNRGHLHPWVRRHRDDRSVKSRLLVGPPGRVPGVEDPLVEVPGPRFRPQLEHFDRPATRGVEFAELRVEPGAERERIALALEGAACLVSSERAVGVGDSPRRRRPSASSMRARQTRVCGSIQKADSA